MGAFEVMKFGDPDKLIGKNWPRKYKLTVKSLLRPVNNSSPKVLS